MLATAEAKRNMRRSRHATIAIHAAQTSPPSGIGARRSQPARGVGAEGAAARSPRKCFETRQFRLVRLGEGNVPVEVVAPVSGFSPASFLAQRLAQSYEKTSAGWRSVAIDIDSAAGDYPAESRLRRRVRKVLRRPWISVVVAESGRLRGHGPSPLV